jgi:hypothetical protein
MKKKGFWLEKKTHLKNKKISIRFCWVARVTGKPGGLIRFDHFFTLIDLLLYPD